MKWREVHITPSFGIKWSSFIDLNLKLCNSHSQETRNALYFINHIGCCFMFKHAFKEETVKANRETAKKTCLNKVKLHESCMRPFKSMSSRTKGKKKMNKETTQSTWKFLPV